MSDAKGGGVSCCCSLAFIDALNLNCWVSFGWLPKPRLLGLFQKKQPLALLVCGKCVCRCCRVSRRHIFMLQSDVAECHIDTSLCHIDIFLLQSVT